MADKNRSTLKNELNIVIFEKKKNDFRNIEFYANLVRMPNFKLTGSMFKFDHKSP